MSTLPNGFTQLQEYLTPDGISGRAIFGYTVNYPSSGEFSASPYAYKLINISNKTITKVGIHAETQLPGYGIWLYKFGVDQTNWNTIYCTRKNSGSSTTDYVQNTLIMPNESFVINMQQLLENRLFGNFMITSIELSP